MRHQRQPTLDLEAGRQQRGLDVGRQRADVLEPRRPLAAAVRVDEGVDVARGRCRAVVRDRVVQVRVRVLPVERREERPDLLVVAAARGRDAQVRLDALQPVRGEILGP
ncbi:MAG: hypothetical protein ACJ74L_07925 [Gaiellaceae bacterium]